MSYKITFLYGTSHGHDVSLCLRHIWEYMVENIDLVTDLRGKEYLETVFCDLDFIFEYGSQKETLEKLRDILHDIGLNYNEIVKENYLETLTSSVNENKLKNNPVNLNKKTIKKFIEN